MVEGAGLAVVILGVGGAAVVLSAGYLGVRCFRLGSLLGLGGLMLGGVGGAVAVALPEVTLGLAGGMLEGGPLEMGLAVPVGSILFNVLIFALAFGGFRGRSAMGGLPSGYGGFALLAFVLVALLGAAGLVGWDGGLRHVGVGTVVVVLVYLCGLFLLGRLRTVGVVEPVVWPGYGSAALAWLVAWGLLLALVTGSYLVVEGVARFAGRADVSLVMVGMGPVAALMALPEAVVTVWAFRRGRADYACGVLLGSCCLNVVAVCVADLFWVGGVLFSFLGSPHLVAAGAASVLLLLTGLVLSLSDRESGRGAGVVFGGVAGLSVLGLVAALAVV